MDSSKYRVAIADDDGLYRFVAKSKISAINDLLVTIEAIDGFNLLEQLDAALCLPDICILDLSMPVLDGYETLKILNQKWPTIKTLVISQYCERYAIENVIALCARGIMAKQEMLESLTPAITAIITKGYYCSAIAGRELFAKAEKKELKPIRLSKVEKEILVLLCKDISYEKIAQSLHKSRRTIEKHKQNISEKIGVNSRAGLILFAIKNEFSNPLC